MNNFSSFLTFSNIWHSSLLSPSIALSLLGLQDTIVAWISSSISAHFFWSFPRLVIFFIFPTLASFAYFFTHISFMISSSIMVLYTVYLLMFCSIPDLNVVLLYPSTFLISNRKLNLHFSNWTSDSSLQLTSPIVFAILINSHSDLLAQVKNLKVILVLLEDKRFDSLSVLSLNST